VGLIVPHIMRSVLGEESGPLIGGCAMGGAVMLLLCDTLARSLFAPYVLPVGIVLSLIGGEIVCRDWEILKQVEKPF